MSGPVIDSVLDPKTACDLCALPVGAQPFRLVTPEKSLAFCCEGCKGIYQMLHNIKDTPPSAGG